MMRWPFLFHAILFLLPWTYWGTIVSGKRSPPRGLLSTHRVFHKKFYGNDKLLLLRPSESTNARKRSFVAVHATSGLDRSGSTLPHDHVASKQPDNRAAGPDPSDVEFIDEPDGKDAVEITSGPEEGRRESTTENTITPGRKAVGEKQVRRQRIESAALSDRNGTQAGGQQSNDEVFTEKEHLSSDNVGSEYGNTVQGGAGLSRGANPLTDEARSDYRSAGFSMAEGTRGDSTIFHDESDGVGVGTQRKSDSGLGEQHVEQHVEQHERRPYYLHRVYNDEERGMPSVSNNSADDDDTASLVEEVVTVGEEAGDQNTFYPQETHSAGGTAFSRVNKISAHSVGDVASSNEPQNPVESKTSVDTQNSVLASVDDEGQTDVEEIDDAENKEMVDGDISVLDQPTTQVDGGNHGEHVEDAKELTRNKQRNADYENADSVLDKTNGDKKENTENILGNIPQNEADQTKQFAAGQKIPLHQQAFENQLVPGGENPLPLQVPRPQTNAETGGRGPAKSFPDINGQALKLGESGNKQKLGGPARELSATPDNLASASNKSLGLLMHQILLNYFRNESALHGILYPLASTAGVPLADSRVRKDFRHENKLLPGNDFQLNDIKLTDKLSNPAELNAITETTPKTKKETTSGASEGMPAYMDPAPSAEGATSLTPQAIKKQELSDSGGEMILVLKNKTFGFLIGRHKNATVRLLSAESPLKRDGGNVTANKAPKSDGGGKMAAKATPHRNKEQMTTSVNDTKQSKVDTDSWTKTAKMKPQNMNLGRNERPLNRPDVNVRKEPSVSLQETVSSKDVSLGSAGSKVDDRTQNSASYLKDLKSIEVVLSRDFMKDWMYDQTTFEDLGITPTMLRAGVTSMGVTTRLERVFSKALKGVDINLLIVAGSMSAGAGLEVDQKNLAGVYYKALVNWWFKSVTPITASKLKVNAVAIGGTDSEYYSYCIQNYIDEPPDIVIWELASNDYQRYLGRNFPPGKPLEQLTRVLLSLPSHPALVFLNFFEKHNYRTTGDCPNSEDEAGDAVAKYYGIPSLSWRNVVCPEIGKSAVMSIDHLFSSDGSHPSITGHAQMASLLITFVKSVFEKTITLERDMDTSLSAEELPALPPPMFKEADFSSNALCWTLLTPDYTSNLRNTLPGMDFVSANGFKFTNISHWPIRLDRQRCLRALDQGAILKIRFFVPPPQASKRVNTLNPSKAREVVVISHNSFRGSAEAWLDENHGEAQVITELLGKRRTQVNILNTRVFPGLHTLTIRNIDQGFCLSAVAIS